MGGFDQVFRMRHHAEHVALFVHDRGDIVERAVGVGAFGITEDNLAIAFDLRQRGFVGEIIAVMMGNGAPDDLALRVGAGEIRLGIDPLRA